MEEQGWISSSTGAERQDVDYTDQGNNRPDPTLSDASIMNSITLALASSGDLAAHSRQLDTGVTENETLRTNPRIDAIRTDEIPVASSSSGDATGSEIPEQPTKRGRGRPKGSLDRNPRARREPKAAGGGSDNGSANENVPVKATGARGPATAEPQGEPIVKRKPGRPRKDRTGEAPTPRTTKVNRTGPNEASSKATAESSENTAIAAALPPVVPPERKEANRQAALRSRLRKAERASILEKMAAGLMKENVALKEKIHALTSLGLEDRSKPEEGDDTLVDWHQTGYSVEAPIDGSRSASQTVDEPRGGSSSLPEAIPGDNTLPATVARPDGSAPGFKPFPHDPISPLQADVERHLQAQVDNLRSFLNAETGSSAGSGLVLPSESSTAKQDVLLLKDIASRLRRENANATRILRGQRDELLMLNQSGDTKPTEGNDEADMVQRLPGERAQKQHAEVESALMNLKRHIGQLMTVSNNSLLVASHFEISVETRSNCSVALRITAHRPR
jgi:hypothetical protein